MSFVRWFRKGRGVTMYHMVYEPFSYFTFCGKEVPQQVQHLTPDKPSESICKTCAHVAEVMRAKRYAKRRGLAGRIQRR